MAQTLYLNKTTPIGTVQARSADHLWLVATIKWEDSEEANRLRLQLLEHDRLSEAEDDTSFFAADALRDKLDALVLHVGQSPERAEQVYDIAFDGYQLSYRMP